MHARKPKNIPERLVRYAAFIEHDPATHAGRWVADVCPGAHELHVDLGCGKGAFCSHEAATHPHALYVGIDCEDLCIAYAAQKAFELGLPNLRLVLADASDMAALFAPGEIDVLHLNFPTPHPRKKFAVQRLTYLDRLIAYRPLFAPGGTLLLKTDSQPFFDFSLTQFELAGYEIERLTRDLHAEHSGQPMTEYEERLSAKGAKIHALAAYPAARPASHEQTAELSLMNYLPSDLESLQYVPLGMEAAVENFRNRRRKEAAKHARRPEA